MPRKGENIFKRKDGRWEARYILRYENGKAKYRYLYGATYREAKEKRLAEQASLTQIGFTAANHSITFDMLAGLWLMDIKITVKESTYTRYHRIIRTYLFPFMGERDLSKMDTAFLKDVTEKLLREGGRKKKSLSPKTVCDILCVLKTIFQYGQDHGYACPNPGTLRYPQKSTRSIKILTEENRMKLEKLLLNAEDTTSLGIFFTLFTGVRIGELCGLRWGDVDFTSFTVHIHRTVERIANLDPHASAKTKIVISEPKTKTSIRTIPLPDFLTEYLLKRKREPTCYLLTGKQTYTEPHQFYVRYQTYLKKHGIDRHTFHALRHTFATRCVEKGFDVKSLSEILGHTNINTTLSVYVHPSIQQKKNQMELLAPDYHS